MFGRPMHTPPPEPLASLSEVVADPELLFIAHASVRKCQEGRTRQGRPFFDLLLADAGRVLTAKIWDDANEAMATARTLGRGSIVKVLFRADQYQGSVQLNVRRLRALGPDEVELDAIFGAGHGPVADVLCRTLVFDIETVPLHPREDLPKSVQHAVDRFSGGDAGAADLACSLSPLLAQVVSLAFADGEAETPQVTVLAVPPPGCVLAPDEVPPWLRLVDEVDLLRAFWVLAAQAEVVVSYNGRNFDVPFLVNRSLLHGVPVRVDLLGSPYALRPHLDLYRVLQPGRALGPAGLDVLGPGHRLPQRSARRQHGCADLCSRGHRGDRPLQPQRRRSHHGGLPAGAGYCAAVS